MLKGKGCGKPNKGGKTMGKVAEVTVVQEAKPVSPAAAYLAIASKSATILVKDEKGVGVKVSNKRATIIAIYLTLCQIVGAKASALNPHVVLTASKLGTYLIGHSEQKGMALKGQEVTGRGVTGYTKFIKEGYQNGRRAEQVKKLLPGGELYKRVEAAMANAKLVIGLYGKVQGVEAMVAACKAK